MPAAHPPEWPEIRSNGAGISRFVYDKTVDYMRRVSENVFIGSATRDEKEMGNYFILSRDLRIRRVTPNVVEALALICYFLHKQCAGPPARLSPLLRFHRSAPDRRPTGTVRFDS